MEYARAFETKLNIILSTILIVIVPFAQDKFDANGNLIDQNTKKFLQQLLQNLANWTRRLKQ
jgi:chromate reductase